MGLKNFFKRILPGHHEFRDHRQLKVLGDILHDPNIFHITRRSAAGGIAIGLFFACLPLPGQMLIAAIFAIYFRVNLPLSVVLVWLTNPITLPPYLFLAYKTGAWLLGQTTRHVTFELTLKWLSETFLDIWDPLILGCLLYGVITSLLGYLLTRWAWRFVALKKWEERKLQRRQMKKLNRQD